MALAQQPPWRAMLLQLHVPLPPQEQLGSFGGWIFFLIDLFAFIHCILVCVPAWYPIQYVYIYFSRNPKAGIPFLWVWEMSHRAKPPNVQICKSILSQFKLSPNIQIQLNTIYSHFATKYGRAENQKINNLIEFLKTKTKKQVII